MQYFDSFVILGITRECCTLTLISTTEMAWRKLFIPQTVWWPCPFISMVNTSQEQGTCGWEWRLSEKITLEFGLFHVCCHTNLTKITVFLGFPAFEVASFFWRLSSWSGCLIPVIMARIIINPRLCCQSLGALPVGLCSEKWLWRWHVGPL